MRFRPAFIAFIATSVVVTSLVIYPFDTKVADNVYFADQLVAGMGEEEVREIVEDQVSILEKQEIKIGLEELLPEDLGVRYDVDGTVNRLMSAEKNFLASLIGANASNDVETKAVVWPEAKFSSVELELRVAAIVDEFEKEPVDASISFEDGEWVLSESEYGREVVNKDNIAKQLSEEVSKDISDPSANKVYLVEYVSVEPNVKASEIEDMFVSFQSKLKQPLQIKLGGGELINIDFNSDEDWFKFDYSNKTYALNEAKLRLYAVELSDRYNEAANTVRIKDIKEHTSEYYGAEKYYKADIEGEMKSGKRLKRDQLVNDLQAAFVSDDMADKVVPLEFRSSPMTVLSDVPGVEFNDLISIGKSSYALGNQPNRVHNIKTAVAYQSGSIIPPGGKYSFNNVGGWVTYGKGYVDGKVIMGSGVVDAPGGGVCQVSTTMFRAAVLAGMDIIKRKPHSWDVSYYQDIHGVDAAVYPPAEVDLAFVNNTPGHILIHGYVNEAEEAAYFEFYGVDDGRKVALGDPWLSRPYGAKTVKTDWTITHADGTRDVREIVSSYWK